MHGWLTMHIIGMSLSYIALVTAFYVDSGPKLPLWDRLPSIASMACSTSFGCALAAAAPFVGAPADPGPRQLE